jgi:hypothetical protein
MITKMNIHVKNIKDRKARVASGKGKAQSAWRRAHSGKAGGIGKRPITAKRKAQVASGKGGRA